MGVCSDGSIREDQGRVYGGDLGQYSFFILSNMPVLFCKFMNGTDKSGNAACCRCPINYCIFLILNLRCSAGKVPYSTWLEPGLVFGLVVWVKLKARGFG